MTVFWTRAAWKDYLRWRELDPKIMQLVDELVIDAAKDSYRRLGNPQPLKEALEGWWSRRIRGEHRLVYRVVNNGEQARVEIVQCRYHSEASD
jgi:toxin YoeB